MYVSKRESESESPANKTRVAALKRQKGIDTMSKKLTKKDKFAALRALAAEAGKTELVEFIDHELELLEKKNSADRKPTAKAVENGNYREAIVAAMKPNTYYSLAQLAEMVPDLNGSTPQRMSGLMKPITNDPENGITDRPVNKVIDKRKALFILA